LKEPYLVVLDADGPVFNGARQKQRVIWELFKREVPLEQCTKPVLRTILGEAAYDELKEEAYNNPVWANQFPLAEGAIEGLQMLCKYALVVIVSRRRQHAAALSEALLRQHGITVPVIGVGQAGARKVEAIASLTRHPNLYVDDDRCCLEAFGADCPEAALGLFRLPYNSQDTEGLVFDGWESLVAYVVRNAQDYPVPADPAFPELWQAIVVDGMLTDISKVEEWESHTDSLTAVLQGLPDNYMDVSFSLRLLAPHSAHKGARVIIATYAAGIMTECVASKDGICPSELPTSFDLTQRTRVEMLVKAALGR
jgi:hypothetical protein